MVRGQRGELSTDLMHPMHRIVGATLAVTHDAVMHCDLAADWCTIALRELLLSEVPDATNAPRVALPDGAD